MWEGLRLQVLLLCLGGRVVELRRGGRVQGPSGSGATGTTTPPSTGAGSGVRRARSWHRSKRGWVWNQFFVIEEYTGPDPVLVGRLHSDVDLGDGNIKYILSGEGAGTIFVIDDRTGNIHATKTLDREEQAEYTLTAQAVARDTNKPLEPPSEFIVKVQDINDNPPVFLHGPLLRQRGRDVQRWDVSDTGHSIGRR
ncbi:hypothetical protein SRHO_G00303670 [Serrasalmus rhombeus]